jgi:hypothetical protein
MNDEKISVWILNSKGGVGKTTLSVAVADLMDLAGRTPRFLEIDSRKRLSSFIGQEKVLSFEGAPPIAEIRKNPNLVLGHYDPIVEAIEAGDSLLDLGANEDPAFLEYCRLSRLDEDLVDEGVRVIALVPTVAENESVRGALEALHNLHEAMPSAERVLVLNARDGENFDRYFSPKQILEMEGSRIRMIEMQRIVSEGWEDFQRERLRFLNVVGMESEEIQRRFGFARPKAKRARGDVAAWFEAMRRSMTGILPAAEA